MFQFPRRPVDKYKASEKQLCKEQEKLIEQEVNSCLICKKSYESYQKHGIPTSPMCKTFENKLRSHIQTCLICNSANRKHNEDAIPITEEVREVVRMIPDKSIIHNREALTLWLKSLKGVDLSKIQRVQDYLSKEIDKKNVH